MMLFDSANLVITRVSHASTRVAGTLMHDDAGRQGVNARRDALCALTRVNMLGKSDFIVCYNIFNLISGHFKSQRT